MAQTDATLKSMISKVDIGDALQLIDSLPNGPLKALCYTWRISPTSYFGQTFKYPLTLLSAMFDTGCVLSGSRALDYFIPGSAGSESDWDFYVPGYKESVADMVNALSRCGVKWNLEAEGITAALHQYGKVNVDRKTLECLSSWVDHLTVETAVALVGKTIFDIVSAYNLVRNRHENDGYCFTSNPSKIIIENDISCDKISESRCNTEDSYGDAFGGSFSILHGRIHTERGPQKVQLIIGLYYGGIRSCTSFIKSFYASHVQCFLSGWCASHLYYRQTLSKKATLWKHHPHQRDDKVEAAVAKYQERGYEFAPATIHTNPTIRNLRDDDSIIIDYGDVYEPHIGPAQRSLLSLWLEERRQNANAFYWTDIECRVSIFCPQEETRPGRGKTYAMGSGLPWCYLGRLADLVARGAKYVESRDPDFRSSVSHSLRGEYLELSSVARSGTVYGRLPDATPWSWAL